MVILFHIVMKHIRIVNVNNMNAKNFTKPVDIPFTILDNDVLFLSAQLFSNMKSPKIVANIDFQVFDPNTQKVFKNYNLNVSRYRILPKFRPTVNGAEFMHFIT